jgi:hypothetical protein
LLSFIAVSSPNNGDKAQQLTLLLHCCQPADTLRRRNHFFIVKVQQLTLFYLLF